MYAWWWQTSLKYAYIAHYVGKLLMWSHIWCPCLVMLAQFGWAKWSASVILVENPLFGGLLSDFNQSHIWCPCLVMLAQFGWAKWSASVILVENPLFGGLLSDFNQSNLRKDTMASAEITLVCGLKVRVGCQDRKCVNSDADETPA